MASKDGEKISGYQLKIGLNGASLRSDHSLGSKMKELLPSGSTHQASKSFKDTTKNYWYYIDKKSGWIIEKECSATPVYSSTVYKIKSNKDKRTFVYKTKSTSSAVVATLAPDAAVTASKRDGDWYYIDQYKGWYNKSSAKSIIVGSTNRVDVSTSTNKKKAKTEEEKAIEYRQKAIKNTKNRPLAETKKIADLEGWVDSAKTKKEREKRQYQIGVNQEKIATEIWMSKYASNYETDAKDADSLLNNSLLGVFGAPYQFNEDTDEKLEGTMYGITYADKIISKMPLLCICPGRVDFMSSYKNSDQVSVLKKLLGLDASDSNDNNEIYTAAQLAGTSLGGVLDSGRYFTFAFDTQEYYNYVNPMCWAGAKFLNIDQVKIGLNGKSRKILGNFNWRDAVADKFKGFLTANDTISFYVDSASTVDEDFSNSFTESQLANKINQFSDIGREIQFLLGASTGEIPEWMTQEDLDTTIAEIGTIAEKYKMENGLMEDIAKNFATVATGGKLLFPEIWADSEYTKSYNINIKLRTPDADTLSWYLNIYVPLCHLVALTAPRQVSSAKSNGYMSPFLIRAFYKGLFNCDCGIITSLSISRGKEGSWTLNGLPTEVDVSIQLKDLYNVMMISPGNEDAKWFMSNTSLMDYLANNCGININEPDLVRQITMYSLIAGGSMKLLPSNIWNKVHDNIANKLMGMYNGIWKLVP